ncbi:hypothetical protein JOQ06_030107 [Pogonophryne albipinna]|uniref:Uncharacterized protein n=1 Tax=Pogonophryne albipinna TaxID=1090488 RepID=A0AAD6AWH2_9TELE|nr:hypothetical protein JOQ06_030107 [Pogonophryne albipinna]
MYISVVHSCGIKTLMYPWQEFPLARSLFFLLCPCPASRGQEGSCTNSSGKSKLTFAGRSPKKITTSLRPDRVVGSLATKIVFLIELILPEEEEGEAA